MSSLSSGGPRGTPVSVPPEWDRLELAVRRLLDEYAACRRRAEAAERRVAELEKALREVAAGVVDPFELRQRVAELEAENAALRERIEQARAGVSRIAARLRFMEDDRR